MPTKKRFKKIKEWDTEIHYQDRDSRPINDKDLIIFCILGMIPGINLLVLLWALFYGYKNKKVYWEEIKDAKH